MVSSEVRVRVRVRVKVCSFIVSIRRKEDVAAYRKIFPLFLQGLGFGELTLRLWSRVHGSMGGVGVR